MELSGISNTREQFHLNDELFLSDRTLPEYRESLDRAYQEIRELYLHGNKYQQVMFRELRELFLKW